MYPVKDKRQREAVSKLFLLVLKYPHKSSYVSKDFNTSRRMFFFTESWCCPRVDRHTQTNVTRSRNNSCNFENVCRHCWNWSKLLLLVSTHKCQRNVSFCHDNMHGQEMNLRDFDKKNKWLEENGRNWICLEWGLLLWRPGVYWKTCFDKLPLATMIHLYIDKLTLSVGGFWVFLEKGINTEQHVFMHFLDQIGEPHLTGVGGLDMLQLSKDKVQYGFDMLLSQLQI